MNNTALKSVISYGLIAATSGISFGVSDAEANRRYQNYYYQPKQPYIAVGQHLGKYEEDGLDSASPEGVRIEIGTYLDDDLAVEFHYVAGLSEDTIQTSRIDTSGNLVTDTSGNAVIDDINISIQQMISVFLKGDFPIAQNFRLYGLLGYTDMSLQAFSPTAESSATVNIVGNGLSYGLGVEGHYRNNLYWSADYIFYVNTQSNASYTGIAVSGHMRF